MEQLILIHGALGAADQMETLKEKLSEDFLIHILEFEGHGSQSNKDEPFTTTSFIRQLDCLMDEIGEPVHIFGYSMGGFVALISASQGNPSIKSITTLGTKMLWSPEIAEKEARHLNPQKIKDKVPAFAEALQKRHGIVWEDVLHRTAAFMKRLGDEAPINQERMSRIDIPIQLCLADQDHMVTEEETKAVLGWLAHGRFLVIKDSKHPLEQTDLIALASTIRSFVDSIS